MGISFKLWPERANENLWHLWALFCDFILSEVLPEYKIKTCSLGAELQDYNVTLGFHARQQGHPAHPCIQAPQVGVCESQSRKLPFLFTLPALVRCVQLVWSPLLGFLNLLSPTDLPKAASRRKFPDEIYLLSFELVRTALRRRVRLLLTRGEWIPRPPSRQWTGSDFQWPAWMACSTGVRGESCGECSTPKFFLSVCLKLAILSLKSSLFSGLFFVFWFFLVCLFVFG